MSVRAGVLAGWTLLLILPGRLSGWARAQTLTEAASPAPDAPSDGGLRIPYRSLTKTRQLMNTAALKILLLLDYVEVDLTMENASDRKWKTVSLSGIEAARYFVKDLGENTCRTIELVASAFPEGGYELYVYGLEVGPDGTQRNPDLPTIEARLQELGQAIRTERQNLDPQDLGLEIYQLAYMGSDRALAVLKTLGYTIVEYSQEKGETLYDWIYTPTPREGWQLPAVIKLIDAPKTSLMDPRPGDGAEEGGSRAPGERSIVPNIGGLFLHQVTAGDPQQRLLIVYDREDPESLETLFQLLREQIDQPARQIVIEALVIEINTDRLKELGLSFQARTKRGKYAFDSLQTDPDTAALQPFTFSFSDQAPDVVSSFQATLQALLQSGDAQILSNPSVLVLDGRQARIQVGQEVPVAKSVSTSSGITSSVEYFPVGIVLNLRPRINEDGSEITMQVETIVSAIHPNNSQQQSEAIIAPTVDNRQVQTFVRVADDTPFIIGGLISTDKRERIVGVPVLSEIPILGMFFRQKTRDNVKREVIIVLTPHVMPLQEKNFSYVLPQDSDMFDSFGHRLFRNAYRLRSDDVFDLEFIYESEPYQNLIQGLRERCQEQPHLQNTEPFASLLKGAVPGEEILVHRMLWEIVRNTGYGKYIDPKHIIFFDTDFRVTRLHPKLSALPESKNTLVLTFGSPRASPDKIQPQVEVRSQYLPLGSAKEKRDPNDLYEEELKKAHEDHPDQWTLLLTDSPLLTPSPLDRLRSVLALKRVLALNGDLPRTIREFRVGRQILFPSQQDLQQNFHVVDRKVAQLFYEVMHYYPAFEEEFNRQIKRLEERLESDDS